MWSVERFKQFAYKVGQYSITAFLILSSLSIVAIVAAGFNHAIVYSVDPQTKQFLNNSQLDDLMKVNVVNWDLLRVQESLFFYQQLLGAVCIMGICSYSPIFWHGIENIKKKFKKS